MERLTGRFEHTVFPDAVTVRGRRLGEAYFENVADYQDYADALDKLAAYEDAEEHGRLVVLSEPTPDIDFMRIFNLVMADAEDRVIVLPCKVGDAIFLVERGNILEEKVLGFIEEGCGLIMNVTYRDYVARPKCENIGKLLDDEHLSVFLSREEAEKALDVMKCT